MSWGSRLDLITRAEVDNLCRIAARAAATTALEDLRALPVEQRMAAMGMRLATFDDESGSRPLFVEAFDA